MTLESSTATATNASSNLPLPISLAFTGDDLALIFGTCLLDAAFVVDSEDGVLSACNQRFCSLASIDPETLRTEDRPWETLIEPADRGIFRTWERTLTGGTSATFDVRIERRGGAPVPVHVTLTSFFWKQRRYLLAFVREVSEAEGREEEWKQQFEEQKTRAFEAIKSSLRLFQLNEKIRRTPHLTRNLLHAGSEAELFGEAARVLTCEEGLGYRDAAFLLLEESVLVTVFSTQPVQEKSYPLTGDNRFSRFVKRGFKTGGSSGSGILVPLESRGTLLGFCEVTPHAREKVFFDESGVVSEWQKDVLFDIGGIIALILDNLRLNRELKRQSHIDPLTQAYNRHYFVDRLTAEIERANRYGRAISLLFVDIDEFKNINDRFGHLQGDEVLRILGRLILTSLRDVDIVCRYGGDEFVILLPETDVPMAIPVAQKLLAGVHEHPFRLLDDPTRALSVTISVGLSGLQPGQRADALLQAADEALYRAKSLGRNRLEVLP